MKRDLPWQSQRGLRCLDVVFRVGGWRDIIWLCLRQDSYSYCECDARAAALVVRFLLRSCTFRCLSFRVHLQSWPVSFVEASLPKSARFAGFCLFISPISTLTSPGDIPMAHHNSHAGDSMGPYRGTSSFDNMFDETGERQRTSRKNDPNEGSRMKIWPVPSLSCGTLFFSTMSCRSMYSTWKLASSLRWYHFSPG